MKLPRLCWAVVAFAVFISSMALASDLSVIRDSQGVAASEDLRAVSAGNQPSATIDPNSLNVTASSSQWMTTLELKGTAANASELYIVILFGSKYDRPDATNDFEFLTSQAMAGETYRLFGSANNGQWDTSQFTGHPIILHTGTYKILVFDRLKHLLLTTGILDIHK